MLELAYINANSLRQPQYSRPFANHYVARKISSTIDFHCDIACVTCSHLLKSLQIACCQIRSKACARVLKCVPLQVSARHNQSNDTEYCNAQMACFKSSRMLVAGTTLLLAVLMAIHMPTKQWVMHNEMTLLIAMLRGHASNHHACLSRLGTLWQHLSPISNRHKCGYRNWGKSGNAI